jgi:hypothetical protein
VKIVADENVDRQNVDLPPRRWTRGSPAASRDGGGIEGCFDQCLSATTKGKDMAEVRIPLE